VIAVPPLSSSSTSSSVDNDLDSDVKGAFTVWSQLTASRLLADDSLYYVVIRVIVTLSTMVITSSMGN